MKYTRQEAVLLSSRDTDGTSCPEGNGNATGFLVLLVLGSGRQDGEEVLGHQSNTPRGIPLVVKSWGQPLQGPPLGGED